MKHLLLFTLALCAVSANAQSLLGGPNGPEVALWSQPSPPAIVLELSNPVTSNNAGEAYSEIDATVPAGEGEFSFQGYLVYQVADANVGIMDRHDIAKARIVAQSDRTDGVANLQNSVFDSATSNCVWTYEVAGDDLGIDNSPAPAWDAFNNTALVEGQEYCYMVVAYAYGPNYKAPGCPDGAPFLLGKNGPAGGAIQPECIVFAGATGIEVAQEPASIRIAPNPAAGRVQVSTSNGSTTAISIIDLTGKTVLKGLPSANHTIDLSSWSPGLYFVRATDAAGQQTTQKLLIQ